MLARDPWFEPLWRRLLTLGLALAWLAVELVEGAYGIWFYAALAVTAYIIVELFIRRRLARPS